MNTNLLKLIIFAYLIFKSLEINANDSEAIIVGESVVLKKSQHISMESEELIIKPKQIQVKYQFKNNSKEDIETQIAFPIRQEIKDPSDWWTGAKANKWISLEPEGYISKKINFLAFVNNQKIDVSGKLKGVANKVDLVYFWTQKFPAKKTIEISHSYYPAGVSPLPPMESRAHKSEIGALIKNYCISPGLKEWMRKNSENIYMDEIFYILKTGANWKGPIKKFSLFIEKETSDQKVSLCMNNLKKIDDKTFLFEKTNFIPKKGFKNYLFEISQKLKSL